MAEPHRHSSTGLRVGAGAVLVALCGLLASMAMSFGSAGARPPSPDKTIPTLPPSTELTTTALTTTAPPTTAPPTTAPPTTAPPTTEPPTTAPPTTAPSTTAPPTTAAETTEAVETTAPVETGIGLRAGAQLPEMIAAATQALGSNGDIAAALGRFAVVPAGIPTPVNAEIESLQIDYFSEPGHFVASSAFTTDAVADDVVAYYETVLTAKGFELTEATTDAGRVSVEFGTPSSQYDGAEVSVTIDSETGEVQLEVTDYADGAVLQAFSAWPAGMPTIGDAVPIIAELSATGGPNVSLFVSTTYAYDDVTPDDLTAHVRDELADGAGLFRLAADDDGSSTITLTHRLIDSPQAQIEADPDGVTTMRISGVVTIG